MADLDLSEYNGASLVATSVTFLALSWISVLLRIYVRAFMTKCFQLDDWFMVVGQVQHQGSSVTKLDEGIASL